jgi:carbamoyltransferase
MEIPLDKTKPVYILGLSAFYHDSAACLLKDGRILAAAQEERFSRRKHDPDFPRQAVAYCLAEAGISIQDISYVAFYEKPLLKFQRLAATYLAFAPRGLESFLQAMPEWLGKKLFMKKLIIHELGHKLDVHFVEHHQSHAASAFFPSPFQESAVLTIDGVGEWTTTSWGVGQGNRLELKEEIRFPHSLGLLYSTFTYYTGFRVNSGEYKLMGLAPYGQPVYADVIRKELIDIKDDGSFCLNMDYFNYCTGLAMTNDKFHALLGGPPRKPETEITQRHMDIARSIQEVTEEVMLKMAMHVYKQTGLENLCMAGGVALNCVGNGKILKKGPFKRLWVQPAAGDAGGALGAALAVWHEHLGHPREAGPNHDLQQGTLLGPDIKDEDVKSLADAHGWVYEYLADDALAAKVAELVSREKVVGLCQGRMEFGPRALGSRSIIGDPRSQNMQSVLNLKVKFRESFRPFAPSVLAEKADEYFDIHQESPYMLLVADVNASKRVNDPQSGPAQGIARLKAKRSQVPAVTHVDYSARIHTVSLDRHPHFYRIIKSFEQMTGCPVMINTSFNIRGEPIVCSAADAYRCFMCTEMDYLVIGHYLFERQKQPNQDKFKKEQISTILD